MVKSTLRYLINTKTLHIDFVANDDKICVYSDADYANDKVDRLSISGIVIFLFGCPIAWRCKKQTIQAKSSTIAEFIAADLAIDVVEVIKMIVEQIEGREVETVLKMDSQPSYCKDQA